MPMLSLILYSSSFCGACSGTRAVLDRAVALVPSVSLEEINVAFSPDVAEEAGITETPTVVLLDAGTEVFRAAGVPTVDQVLTALAARL